MALVELLLQRPGDSLGVETVSWTRGARLELPGSHVWSLTPQNKVPPACLYSGTRARLSNTSAL